MMKKKIFIAAAVIISSAASAQDSTKNLNEVLVTATKFLLKQSQTGKVVIVINKEQLERSSGKTVAEVLNEQAGITINGAYNAAGSVQTVFMRGASSGRTLILLDGIPVSDPSMINNEFDLHFFSINDVERIEICKGAQSTLYGSDAIAGVINIITVKKDISGPFHVKASFTGGNRHTIRTNFQLYGKISKLSYAVRYAKFKTNGFSSAYDSSKIAGFDNDGFNGDATSASVQYQVIPSLQLRAFIQYNRYKADVDASAFVDENDYTINNNNLSAGGGLDFKKGIIAVTANYQYGEAKRKYLNDSLHQTSFTKFEDNRYRGRSQYVELFANIRATKWLTVLAGGDYRWTKMHQKYYSESNFFPPYDPLPFDSSLHNISFYSSVFFSAFNKKLNIEAGGRFNNHSRYGNNGTFTFNPSFSFNNNWRIFGSIASGFKAPSIYQVFDQYSGNVDLKPERSINFEIGVQETWEMISSRIVYFHRDIRNGIDYDNNSYKYFNFIKQTVNGLELEVSAHPVKNLDVSANYTYISGEEQTQSRKTFSDTTYKDLLRRPKHNFNFNVGYHFLKAFYANISLKSVSSHYDVGGYMADDILLDKYVLLNAYAEYKWKGILKLFVDFQNITNKKFFDTKGYNAIPFTINGGVAINW